MSSAPPETVEWRAEPGRIAYRDALDAMTARNRAIAEGEAREMVWLLEHPPVYTAGTSADGAELLDPRLEVIATLGDIGVTSWRSAGRVGIWTKDVDGREAKIGAIGVRVRRWVTMHGFSVNLAPDLSHFTGIVPCGIEEFGVTSLERLGIDLAPAAFDEALRARFGDFLAALEGKANALP